MMPSSKKKYKLLKASDEAKPVCAFFSSPDGCRNGDKCSFLHGPPPAPEVSESASIISSEESEAGVKCHSLSLLSITDSAVKKNAGDGDGNPFSLEPDSLVAAVETSSKQKKRKKSKGGDDLFAKPKEKQNSLTGQKRLKLSETPHPVPTRSAATKVAEVPAKSAGVADFRSLIAKLPVASFVVPGTESSKKTPETPSGGRQKNHTLQENVDPRNIVPDSVLPSSTEEGKKWMKSVQASRKHERYASSYDFSRYKQLSKEAGATAEWIRARPFGDWCMANPQAIAIDCEMCETQDPLTGAKNPKALCRISVVNAGQPDEVLLDTLVKPTWPVTDYRTRINGITKEDLANVEFTLRHAQAFMMALCSEETVIVGHAVQNDLAALFMEHYCVADSSFLFFAKDSTTSSVSLKDLVFSIFKLEMPETHDSVNDARKALDCVRHWVEKDGDVDSIERTAKHNGNQLFVHRIPKHCKTHHLTSMFVKHTSIEPSSIDEVEFSGDAGKTHATFRSARHASLAFDSLEGTSEVDASGRLQKRVYMRNGDYVKVRKMIHNHRASTPSKPTPSRK